MDYSTFKALTPSICSCEDWERFCKKITVSETGCWIWQGKPKSHGYGGFYFQQKDWYSHRVAYLAVYGEIPAGLHLDHLCRNRICCNPAHLQPVTFLENIRRGNGPSAQNARKTHCKHGHEFTPENTYIRREGRRHCKMCFYLNARKRKNSVGYGMGANNRDKTHCVRGHEFTSENTRIRKDGSRRCIACQRQDNQNRCRGKEL